MNRKSTAYRNLTWLLFVLIYVLSCDNDNGPLPPINRPPKLIEIKADPTSVRRNRDVVLTALATDADGDNLRYEWIITGDNNEPATQWLIEGKIDVRPQSQPSIRTFNTDKEHEYDVSVTVSDQISNDEGKLLSPIKVSGVQGFGEEVHLVQSKQFITSESSTGPVPASDPLLVDYGLHILVIDNNRDSAELNQRIDVKPDGTWEQLIEIGEPEDIDKPFTLNLVLINKERFNEFENLLGQQIKFPFTIPNFSFVLSLFKQSKIGQEIFDDTFDRVDVIRE